MASPPISLKGRALRLLSGREYSRLELERRLEKYEEEPGALAKALDELQAKDFISEQRVLESVVHRRAAKLHQRHAEGRGHPCVTAADRTRELRGGAGCAGEREREEKPSHGAKVSAIGPTAATRFCREGA